jgi:glycosyltransferase involved in cell wall biosynthesis
LKIVSVMTTSSSGGAEFAAVEMLDALAARGHECVMISDQPGIGRGTAVAVRPIAIGPKLSVSSRWSLALRWLPNTNRLRKALAAEAPYDVLLLHYKKEQVMARMLPSRLRATLVWCEWGPVPFPMRKGIPRWAYLRAADQVALVMAISQGTADNLIDVGVSAAKVVTVANAMRTEEIDFSADGRARVRERLGIPADAFVVGCISRFHPKKRNDVVVDAVRQLEDERAHLILAGSGETEAALRTRGAPLGDRLHVIPTPREDVGDVLSAFDVSVFCPSPTEGQPRATILGMLARRPCLSTGAEGVSDMITPEFGAISSPENDPTALAMLLTPYLDDPELARRQGEAARAHAEAVYAAPVVAEKIEGLFRAAGARG